MQRAAVTFAFTAGSTTGTDITVQQQSAAAQSGVPVFSPVTLTVSLPESANGMVSGILKTTLAEFPYPFTVSLYAAYPNGDKDLLTSFRHPGGACSVPYTGSTQQRGLHRNGRRKYSGIGGRGAGQRCIKLSTRISSSKIYHYEYS